MSALWEFVWDIIASDDAIINPEYIKILRQLVDFDKIRPVVVGEDGTELVAADEDDPTQFFELMGATLKQPFVTIKLRRQQFIFNKQGFVNFDRIYLCVEPTRKYLKFIHDDGTWTSIDPMLWTQYLKSEESVARPYRTQFMYQSSRADGDGVLYVNAFFEKDLMTLRGTTLRSGTNIHVSKGFVVLSDNDLCPLPSFSIPPVVFGTTGWLGVGVRGCEPVSTDLLELIGQTCSSHFGVSLAVVPLDINDTIISCEGCDDPRRACVCSHNVEPFRKFSFISHLCLLNNIQDAPFGNLAAGFWVSLDNQNKVALELEGILLRVISVPHSISALDSPSATA